MDENDQSLRIEYRVCEWVLEIKCVHGDEQSSWELSECFLCRRKIPSKEAKKWELYATQQNEDWEKIDTFKGHLVEKREDFSPCFS